MLSILFAASLRWAIKLSDYFIPDGAKPKVRLGGRNSEIEKNLNQNLIKNIKIISCNVKFNLEMD